MSMNYEDELKRLLENTGDFWKPKEGQHKVVALSELTEAEPFKADEESEPQARSGIKIRTEDKEFQWNFPKGRTPASTYGQLVSLAAKKGKLQDLEFTVVVVGQGQNIRFTIVEQ